MRAIAFAILTFLFGYSIGQKRANDEAKVNISTLDSINRKDMAECSKKAMSNYAAGVLFVSRRYGDTTELEKQINQTLAEHSKAVDDVYFPTNAAKAGR